MATARKADVVRAGAGDAWMSVPEASRMLGESRLKVLSRTVKGELIAQHVAGRAFVSRESVERLLKSMR